MVDEKRVSLMRDAGLWTSTMGIQSGSERIRRDCYERETSQEDIIKACEILASHGVGRNLDFIGDNPYETDADRRETVDLLCRLPKPFFFNYFSLTFFPGVELTDKALADGYIGNDDIEDVAQKGYHLWGGSLTDVRLPEQIKWDIAYTFAVHGVPKGVINRLLDSPLFVKHIRRFAQLARGLRAAGRWKSRVLGQITKQPDILQLIIDNTNRDQVSGEDMVIQPNMHNSPFNRPLPPPARVAAPAAEKNVEAGVVS
jgi:hypothetical protein